jgi:hypothetical protein
MLTPITALIAPMTATFKGVDVLADRAAMETPRRPSDAQ